MSSNANHESVLAQVYDHARQTALLDSVNSLLEWDERTIMPLAAGEYRADQITLLSGMLHERRTAPQLGDWLSQLADSPLAADPHSDEGANIRHLKRDYDKNVKLPKRLVEELARTTIRGQQVWTEARAKNDFPQMQPWYEKIVALKREEADALGYDEQRYDALLDQYEPGEKTSNVARVLEGLRQELVPLVATIANSHRRPDLSILQRTYPTADQERFGRAAAEKIGFEFNRGRIDVTAHPFCSTMGPHDCRITTRYDERFMPSAFFGILHEAGHGLYELGLRPEMYGLPAGQAVSLGIHESQSRMWENLVGRSEAFWEYFYPLARQKFPGALADTPVDDFFFAVNDVRPSLIRVEADEATYNLHILVRFELEQDLIAERLTVADLPGAWNEKYRDYLGITPPNHGQGVLQDIHWSAGLIGYFPTYSLGNLYASQLFAQASQDLGSVEDDFRRGHFESLLSWLRQYVHRRGRCYSAAELVKTLTGSPLSHRPLIDHLQHKLGALYDM